MIPIFSIICLILFLGNLICFLKLHFSYRKTKSELVGYYSKVFLFLALMFGFFATPQIITENLKLIEVSLDLALFCGLIIIAIFVFIPFKLYLLKKPPKILVWGIILVGLVILIFNIVNLKPAYIHFYNGFVFWEENRSLVINIFSGSLLGLCALGAGTIFILGALKTEDKIIKLRAFFLASSIIFLFLGAGMRLAFGFLFNIFLSTLLGLLFSLLSVILVIIGIFLVKPKKEGVH